MRINYNRFVYCADCYIKSLKMPGIRQRCSKCNKEMRRTPVNRIYMEKEVKRY